MDRINKVKELTDSKKTGVKEENKNLISRANKGLNVIINDSIKKAQEGIGEENRYKEYLIKNKEYIKAKVAVNAEVNTIEEAMALIFQVDFRYIFGFDVSFDELFSCEFINNEQKISIAFSCEQEAIEALEIETAKYPCKEIGISGYERFGMKVIELTIKGDNAEAWISYNSNRNKYLYMVGNNTKDNYAVTHTYDVVDLFQVFYHCDIRKTKQELCELLDIKVKELDVIRSKYIRNKVLINTSLIKDKFPILSELIGEHIPKLETVLDVAINELYYHMQSNNNWVFSSSMKYLAGIMNKSKSTINPIINTFALLGLVQKTSLDDGKYSTWNRNEITYFYIPEYNEELFKKAEQLAKIMLYDGERITATGFSYSKCIGRFCEETANSIFKDKVTKARAS